MKRTSLFLAKSTIFIKCPLSIVPARLAISFPADGGMAINKKLPEASEHSVKRVLYPFTIIGRGSMISALLSKILGHGSAL
jgi:hypothetical protein